MISRVYFAKHGAGAKCTFPLSSTVPWLYALGMGANRTGHRLTTPWMATENRRIGSRLLFVHWATPTGWELSVWLVHTSMSVKNEPGCFCRHPAFANFLVLGRLYSMTVSLIGPSVARSPHTADAKSVAIMITCFNAVPRRLYTRMHQSHTHPK